VSTSSHRLKTFLDSYKFYPNSVDFRIVSSKALEKWKNVQSYQLNQLANGKFFFPPDRREVLLLKYDMWSRWLVEVENLCIELGADHHSNILQNHDMDIIISLAEKTAGTYSNIIESHNEFFDTKFGKIWLESHEHAFSFMKDELRSLQGTYTQVFVYIVDLLCEIMQYTLTEIHELNHILLCKDEYYKDQDPNVIFMVVTPFCKRFASQTDGCLLTQRLSVYKKYFDFDTVYFKNFTNHPLSEQLIGNVESTGVKIDYKKSLFA
jgi:hypothetical protein